MTVNKPSLEVPATPAASMAIRRYLQALTRQPHPTFSLLFTNQSSLRSISAVPFPGANNSSPIFTNSKSTSAFVQWSHLRYFCSNKQDDHFNKDDAREEEEDCEDDEGEEDYENENDSVSVSSRKKVYTPEEKEAEAADIGYKVMGPLQKNGQVFKPYEPVFAVVQSPSLIYTE